MADSEQVPLAVTRLLSARYPTLEVDPRWLQTCVQTSASGSISAHWSTRQARASSTTSTTRLGPGRRRSPSYTRSRRPCFAPPTARLELREAIFLVQIESMIDIGFRPLRNWIAEARREARRANIDPNEVPVEEVKTASTASSRADHMADFQAQEDDKIQATTVYPRRMLKLELSDGSKNGTAFAIESQRVPALDMNTTKIGPSCCSKSALLAALEAKKRCSALQPVTSSKVNTTTSSTMMHGRESFIFKPWQRPPAAQLPGKGMSQTSAGESRSQRSDTAATRPSATQENPISLIDSDEDADGYDDGTLIDDVVLDVIASGQPNRSIRAAGGCQTFRRG
ncbi:uncharacterized protein UTRI_02411 [Ustilago trichophora]|uniref:RecQ mediated genome instability protein 1 OB-fold domain-containing protein n=1 Tax=Ustilago trichophora TaxID=86804 RepID=A0A5C3E7T7_9BASI|nr:uncharacterized protein UTRI_02411 [Ustilago trichophora]